MREHGSMEAGKEASIHQTKTSNYKKFQDVLQMKFRMQWAGIVSVDNYGFPSEIF